ncbi:O-antigen polymerase [Crenobacter caeni]|uniref:Oligosaccharide repeat unit polymerase n=1 Tax=Crenobacter caeni TaxID=2705474 RepID=A0A6B2KSS4_9NEIS|nr:O-antigen polymerase [Crenobacter caeni]NDV13296.1 oligosaccharide repeat unit polymerase [Crenobacter caeni]
MNKIITHPFIIFFIVWSTVIALYSGKWSNILIFNPEEYISFYIIYLITPFLFGSIVGTQAGLLKTKNKKLTPPPKKSITTQTISNKKIKILLTTLIIGSTFEAITLQGVPLTWAITGDSRGYADYGYSGLHGILNSINLYLLMVYFIKYIEEKKDLNKIIFLFIWMLCMFSRFLVMVSIVQLFFVYLYKTNNLKVITFVKLTMAAITISFIFGTLGNIRSFNEGTSNSFMELAEINENYPAWIPNEFTWSYMYLTTPFNNLLNIANTSHINYSLTNTLSGLVPNVLKKFIFAESDLATDILVHESFNMSTGYAPIVNDLGTHGIIIFNILLGLISSYKWCRIKNNRDCMEYAIIAQSVFYLIFFNPLLSLPIIFQFLLIWYSKKHPAKNNN